jgi:hypothetical protein
VSVGEAVAKAEPDAIVHQMTAIGGKADMKHFDRWFATTSRPKASVSPSHNCWYSVKKFQPSTL